MNCKHIWVTVREDADYKYQECAMPQCGARQVYTKPKNRAKR